MSNAINPQIIQNPQNMQYAKYATQPQMQSQVPVQPQTVQPQAQATPAAGSVGAVNIQIYNPTTQNGAAPMYPSNNFYGPNPQYLPYPYPVPYQMNQQLQAQAPIQTPAPAPAPTPAPAAEKKDEKTEKKVVLTDDYIKSLENYLNNENPKVRMMGAKEVMARFKEDKSRKNDIGLTALLNKALQDPSASVRFMALTTLDVGYATGNEESINILKQIQQKSGEQYGEDALLASQILLKSSGQVVDTPAGTGFSTPKKEDAKKETPAAESGAEKK